LEISIATMYSKTDHKHHKMNKNNIDILKNGNCFFRCISKYLYDTQERHQDVRQQTVTTITADQNFYLEFIDGDFQTHIHNVFKSNGDSTSWATEAEILATSETYNIEIFIHTKTGQTNQWNRYSRNEHCDHNKPYTTIVHENNHFSLVQNLQRPCKCKQNNMINIKQKENQQGISHKRRNVERNIQDKNNNDLLEDTHKLKLKKKTDTKKEIKCDIINK